MGEFWFTAATTFFYFTAFVAMLATYCEMDGGDHQYWVDAQIAAGVLGLLNDIIYGLGAYLIYVDWKRTCGSGCTSCCPATCIGCDVSECLKMIVPLVSLPVSTRVSAPPHYTPHTDTRHSIIVFHQSRS